MDKTVDEYIYVKTDWDRITGAARNKYYKWDPIAGTAPERQSGPPRSPLPAEEGVDVSQLEPGDVYPGPYEGLEYTADTSGNVYLAGDKELYATNPQGIPGQIQLAKGSFGRFRVTPLKGYVLVIVPESDGWSTRYVITLPDPFKIFGSDSDIEPQVKGAELKPGDEFINVVHKDTPQYRYKHVRGRAVITKKIRHGEVYALTTKNAGDRERGEAAEGLLDALATAKRITVQNVASFSLTSEGHAVFLHAGKWIYIGTISSQLEFPNMS